MLSYQTQIYNLCFRTVGNQDDAEDMTQESFLKAWRYLSSFQFESAFSTWLYRLATNCCLDLLRSKKRRPTVSLVSEDDDGEEQSFDPVDPAPQPEEALIRKEEQAQLQEALDSLEDTQRQIITLRVVNDLSYTEIAEILDLKEGTVKSRLSRARENLRKKLLQLRNKTTSSTSKTSEGGLP
jgi:RNA polymerase sigma-70 factor (ECF subfamily)